MAVKLVVSENPEPEDRAAIFRALSAFNDPLFGPSNYSVLGVLLKDDAGATVGGLWARTSYDWLYVEMLFVPEALRGQGLGGELLAMAEAEALKRSCAGAWIDTFDDRAKAFYEARGYEAFGVIDGQPKGGRRTFLKKALA